MKTRSKSMNFKTGNEHHLIENTHQSSLFRRKKYIYKNATNSM